MTITRPITMVDEKAIKEAQEKFGVLLRKQLERVEVLKNEPDWTDYSKLDKLIIGVCGGDGIGPYICASAQKVMEVLLLVCNGEKDPIFLIEGTKEVCKVIKEIYDKEQASNNFKFVIMKDTPHYFDKDIIFKEIMDMRK